VPLPDVRRLLDRLDRSHDADRVRTMALIGREGSGDPALAAFLDEVAAPSEYHQHLVLVAASAAGDARRLTAALRHPSLRIRARALASLDPEHVQAHELVGAMLRGSAADRRLLRRYVNRHRLTEVAEAAIEALRSELGDREAAALLATCTEDTVRRLLPELLYAVPHLGPLARRHPTAVLDHLETQLQGLPRRQRDQLWSQVDPALAELALARPDRLLGLIESVGPSWVVPHGLRPVMRFLVRRDPARVARLLVRDELVQGLGWQLLSGLAAARATSPSTTRSRSPGRCARASACSPRGSGRCPEPPRRGLHPCPGGPRHVHPGLADRPPRPAPPPGAPRRGSWRPVDRQRRGCDSGLSGRWPLGPGGAPSRPASPARRSTISTRDRSGAPPCERWRRCSRTAPAGPKRPTWSPAVPGTGRRPRPRRGARAGSPVRPAAVRRRRPVPGAASAADAPSPP
jgi:hypothetical protein